jgi:hypothetical protein
MTCTPFNFTGLQGSTGEEGEKKRREESAELLKQYY